MAPAPMARRTSVTTPCASISPSRSYGCTIAVTWGRRVAEVVHHLRIERHRAVAVREGLAVDADADRAPVLGATCARSAAPRSLLAAAISAGTGPAVFRNSSRKAPRRARAPPTAN